MRRVLSRSFAQPGGRTSSGVTLLFAGLLVLAGVSGTRAATINVNFSDDSAATWTVPGTGDQFFLTGQSGSIVLTPGVPATINAMVTTESLTCCWDDNTYPVPDNHTLTLNGVGHGFSQTWTIIDHQIPVMSLTSDGAVLYSLPSGTISVTMDAASDYSTGAFNGDGDLVETPFNNTATLLYTEGVPTPEPATLALLGAGMFGLGFARRRRR